VDVAGELRARLKVPIAVGNDANCGALAEATFGAAAGATDVLYVLLSAGVGLGMVLRGRLYEGYRGTAGELGHVVVEPGGSICRCGDRGCLETVAGTHAVLEAIGRTHDEMEIDDLLLLVAAGDTAAVAAVRSAGERVGAAVAGICRVLDPAVLVIGGELAEAGNALLSPIRAAFAGWERAPRIMRGTVGPEAEALGAAAAAMRTAAALTKQLT
jgi:predicted NBD/HSP70 family sugar kinase